MAESARNGRSAGIGLGGILVIVGIVVAIIWSVWLGIIIASSGSSPSAASPKASGTERASACGQRAVDGRSGAGRRSHWRLRSSLSVDQPGTGCRQIE